MINMMEAESFRGGLTLEKVKKTRRQIQAEDTKNKIFKAAMQLLEQEDFDSITIREIVRAADVSIGTFYNYYETKRDVFCQTYQIADDYFQDEIYPQLQSLPIDERFRFFFDAYTDYNCMVTPLTLTKIIYHPDNKNFHRHNDYGMIPILVELIDQAKAELYFHTQEASEDIAQFFMVCLRGVVYDWCTCDGSYDLKHAIRQYSQKLLKIYL